MAVGLDNLLEQALALPPADRARLVTELLASLQSADPEAERLWLEEAKRRIAAYEAGEVETICVEEVFAEIDRELDLK